MIHIYQLNGYNLVLDINSGAVHAVTDLAYAILEISGSDRLAPQEEIVVSLKFRFPEAERQMLRHLSMVLNRLRVMEVPILIIFGVDRRGRIIQNLRW